MKWILATLTTLLLTLGFAQSNLAVTEERLPEAETVLDEGFLSGGTISGGISWQLDNSLIVDGSYFRPIISVSPLELYSVTSLKATVYNIAEFEVGGGLMTGFGFSYFGETLSIGGEARLWATATYGVTPSLQPEFVLFTSFPSELLFGP